MGALVEIREAGRYPDGRYDLLAAATGRFAIDTVDPAREPYLVADVTPLEDEVGDEARAERLAASAIRRFVRYLELMRARDGETSEVLDIRVEVETAPFESDDSDEATDDDDDITDDDIVAAIEDAAATGVVPEPIESRADDDAGIVLGRAPARPRHPRRSDGPVASPVGDHRHRAAAPAGPPRGAHHRRAAGGPHPPAGSGAAAPDEPVAPVLARSAPAARPAPKLSPAASGQRVSNERFESP